MPETNKKTLKILIAEDEVPVAKVLKLKLEEEKHEVQVAINGDEALKALKKEKFDLLLLDLIMPQKDGFTVLKKMKERQDKTPVIILSNLGQEKDIKKAKDLGVKDFFVKSYTSLSKIVEIVEKKYIKK